MADSGIRPDYYKGLGGLEPIHLIHALNLSADAAGVIKYVCRHGRKPGTEAIDDLKKAKTYLDFMIAEAEGHPVIMPAGWVNLGAALTSMHEGRTRTIKEGLGLDLRGVPGPGQDPLSGNDGGAPVMQSALPRVDLSACADDCVHPSHNHEHERNGRPGRRADEQNELPAAPTMPPVQMPCGCREGFCAREEGLPEEGYCVVLEGRQHK